MEIRVLADNVLFVDGEFLLAGQQEKLSRALRLGRAAIVKSIDRMYNKQSKIHREYIYNYPEKIGILPIQRGSVYVMGLTDSEQRIRVPLGPGEFRPRKKSNSEIISHKVELKPEFHSQWETVEGAEFIPEVREVQKGIIPGAPAFCLLVRDAPLLGPGELSQLA